MMISPITYLQYGMYAFVLIAGGIAVKFGIMTVTDVATLLAGLGIGHATASNAISQSINANSASTDTNTNATNANTIAMNHPSTTHGATYGE
jgi:hypothetical protein